MSLLALALVAATPVAPMVHQPASVASTLASAKKVTKGQLAAKSAAAKGKPRKAPTLKKAHASGFYVNLQTNSKANRYEVQVARKGAKTETVTLYKSRWITTSASNTAHTVRYRIVTRSGGKDYRSAWSPSRTMKTAKSGADMKRERLAAARALAAKSKPTKAPGVRQMSWTGMYLAFADTKGAHRYEVQTVSDAKFTKAKTQQMWGSHWVGNLSQNTSYYVRYRVITRTDGTDFRSTWSPAMKATTNANFPGEFTITSTAQKDAATISWTPSKDATHYTVVYGDNKALDINTTTLKNVKSTSLKIPVNARNGSAKYVRIYAHNGTRERNGGRIGFRALAPETSAGEEVTFATQNILRAGIEDTSGAQPAPGRPVQWPDRWPLLVAQVKDQAPDILLLQEASTTKDTDGSYFITPLMDGIQSLGYSLDRPIGHNAGVYSPNRIAFKTSKFNLLDSGTITLSTDEGGRKASWVKLRSKATGKDLFAVSVHVSPYGEQTPTSSRVLDMQIVNSEIAKLNASNLPVLLGGDFNDAPNVSPTSGPFRTMINAGWTDMQSANTRFGDLYGTWNGLRDIATQHDGRIDYLLSLNAGGPLEYRNLISVREDGFTTSLHGSDHNMVWARTRLP